MNASKTFEEARARTKAVYERQAAAWDRRRPKTLVEKAWLDRFLNVLPPGGRVLDLGCGTGEPLGAYFLKSGYALVGVDYAAEMIAIAAKRFPQAQWLVQDMRRLSVEGEFDGIISWDGFFHLSKAEQRAAIPDLAARIRPGGAMLLTVGPREGEATGTVVGETVYHASLSAEEYRDLLARDGFSEILFAPDDPDCTGHSVLLATGKGAV